MSSKAPRGVSTSTRMANNTRTRRQMPCFSVWMSMICRACALSYGGYIDGAVFTVNLPVDLVQSLLPDGLEPIRANGTTHPANLIFCIQTHVGSPFTDFNYDEFILSIPSVQWDDKHKDNYKYRGPFIYLPKLYLNESLPVELGQWWVGDNKELGDIRHFFSPNSGNFSVTGHKRHEYDGKEIIAANWTSSTAFQNTSEFPNFAKQVAPLFNQPSIGQYPLENGTWHCLPQDYHMDTAALMPINGSVSISEQFIGEIPKGTFHFAALKPTVLGSYRLRTAWQYTSLDSDCRRFAPEQQKCLSPNPAIASAQVERSDNTPVLGTKDMYNDSCVPSSTTVCNYQRSVACHSRLVMAPATASELVTAVSRAKALGLRIRAIGRPHSDNGVWCDPRAMLIMMHKLNRIFGLDEGRSTVTVQAGTLVSDLNSFLHLRGLSLGAFYPAYSGLTVGGVLGTGAHGSSLTFPSALGTALVAADVLDAQGAFKHYTLDQHPRIIAALGTHMGALGVIVNATFKVVPEFKLRVKQTVHHQQMLLNGSLLQAFSQHDWVYVGWYQHAAQLVLRVGDIVPSTVPGNFRTDFLTPPLPKLFMPIFSDMNQYAVDHPQCACELEVVSMLIEEQSPPYVDGNNSHSADAVGFVHEMLASECETDQCPWENGLRVEETEIAVPFARGQEALQWLSEHLLRSGICFPLQGVWLRGAKGDNSLLGMGAGNTDMLVIGLTTWRPSGDKPRYNESALEEISHVLMTRFHGRPHWAKNLPSTFSGGNWTPSFGDGMDQFFQVAKEMDPDSVFMNDFVRNLRR